MRWAGNLPVLFILPELKATTLLLADRPALMHGMQCYFISFRVHKMGYKSVRSEPLAALSEPGNLFPQQVVKRRATLVWLLTCKQEKLHNLVSHGFNARPYFDLKTPFSISVQTLRVYGTELLLIA